MRDHQRMLALAIVGIAAVALASGPACPAHGALPPAVDEVLHWLPENTETVAVVQSFTIGKVLDWYEGKVGQRSDSARDFLAGLALEDLGALASPLHDSSDAGRALRALRLIADVRVVMGVYGGRNYDPSDPTHREACGILIFDKSLSASKEFLEAMHVAARGARNLARREVLWLPAAAGRSGPRPPTEGLFVAAPRPNVLIWASSEPYMDEVLRRLGSPPLGRALPDACPEWKHVDPRCGAFLVRHIPQQSPQPVLTGLTISRPVKNGETLRVCYLTAHGAGPKLSLPSTAGREVVARDDESLTTNVDLKRLAPAAAECPAGSGWWKEFALYGFLALNAALPDSSPIPF